MLVGFAVWDIAIANTMAFVGICAYVAIVINTSRFMIGGAASVGSDIFNVVTFLGGIISCVVNEIEFSFTNRRNFIIVDLASDSSARAAD